MLIICVYSLSDLLGHRVHHHSCDDAMPLLLKSVVCYSILSYPVLSCPVLSSPLCYVSLFYIPLFHILLFFPFGFGRSFRFIFSILPLSSYWNYRTTVYWTEQKSCFLFSFHFTQNALKLILNMADGYWCYEFWIHSRKTHKVITHRMVYTLYARVCVCVRIGDNNFQSLLFRSVLFIFTFVPVFGI